MIYKKRIIDKTIDFYSKAFGGILIKGPKGCGKTRTAKERCKTIIEFQDEDKRDSYLLLADSNPSSFLSNTKPILFDEWQDAPKIWGAVRKACDDNPNEFGSYFLTGSTSKNVKTPHTGTMRITTIEMNPLSLYETDESNGEISLNDLFNKKSFKEGIQSKLSLEELIYATCRGGWPKIFEIKNEKAKLLIAKDAFKQICNSDISSIDGTKRKPEWVKAILKSYSRNIGTLCKKEVIYKDVSSNYNFSMVTFDDYVEKLKDLYIIKDYDSWSPQIRSKSLLRNSKKHMFVDPSIAIAALNLNPNYFLDDFDFFGHIFESLVFRDLNVYSQSLGGELSHYHDASDLEVDAVLHLEDGRYALIEIKLGSKGIEKGIHNLLKTKEIIKKYNENKNNLKIKEPDLLIVITGTGLTCKSPEGVYIIPISCLKN